MVDEIKLSNHSLIKSYGQDGEISKEELEVLKQKGVNQEILDALSGAKSQEEVDDIANRYFNDQPMPEEKSKFKAWVEKNPFNGLLAIGVGGALGAVFGAKVALFGGVAALLGSCTTEMNQTMSLSITSDSSNQEIIDYLKMIHGDLESIKNNQEKLEKTVLEIVAYLTELNVDTDRIVDILEGMGADIATISATLAANGTKADEIINLIQLNNDKQDAIIEKLSNGNEETAKLLNQILEAVNKGNDLSDANNALLTQILNKITTMEPNDKDGQDLLNKILAKLTESVEAQKEMNGLTTQFYSDVLAKLDKMNDDMKAGFQNVLDKMDSMDANQQVVANKILAKLEEMSVEQKAFFGAVLDKLDTLPENMTDGINKILDAIKDNTLTDKEILAKLTDLMKKFGNLSAGQETDLTVVVNAIKALGEDAKAILAGIQNGNSQLEAIREAIEKNNQIAQGTQDAVNNLATQNNKDHETIIALMTKLLENDANDAATMDDIKAILNEIKTNTKGNWDTSLRIEDKLNLVAQTINVILETQTGLADETKAILLQILAKIPDGCNCEDVDLTVIVEKLDKLIESTEGRNDPKHEGILDDLDDLLG